MSEPLVTVVIPTYNRPAFLREALASVLAQDYSDFRVLVSDNASPYDVAALVRTFNDPRVSLHIHSRNIGAQRNWRWALSAPVTRYVALLEDDCLWLPHHLSAAIASLEQHTGASFYSCSTEIFGAGKSGLHKPVWSTDNELEVWDWRKAGFAAWLLGVPMAASSVVIRRAALRGLYWGGNTWPWCPDLLWWGQLALAAPLLFNPRIGARYRFHDGNSTYWYLSRKAEAGAQYRFTLRFLAARAYALGGLRDIAGETQCWPAAHLSRIVVSLAAIDSPRDLRRQAHALFTARQDLAQDADCSIHYRLAVRLGAWYLPWADVVARLAARWWPITAL